MMTRSASRCSLSKLAQARVSQQSPLAAPSISAPFTAAACSQSRLLEERGTVCAQLRAVGGEGGSHTWLRKRHVPNPVMWRRSARFGRSPAKHIAS